jgi:hypothetical protein
MNLKYYSVNIHYYLKYKFGLSPSYTQTSVSERECLRKYATGKKQIVEIGIFERVNTKSFRSVMDTGGVLIAINPYPRSFLGLLGFGWIRRIAHEQVNQVENGRVWIEDLGKLTAENTEVKPHPHLSLDFLFIDGDHSYEGIKGDWETWNESISSGGLALHDSVNCKSLNVGSQIFTQEVIKKDDRFTFVEEVDTLSIFVRN